MRYRRAIVMGAAFVGLLFQNPQATWAQTVSNQTGQITSPRSDSIADKSEQSLLNLDLCTLAYQLYHQSLCLPLDPFYDLVSRTGSDRRSNICAFTHEYAATLGSKNSDRSAFDGGFYSGPNSARGWTDSNVNLDPILTNYKHLDARLPAFTRDGERFIAIAAPAYVTSNIKAIDGVRYTHKPTKFPSYEVENFRIKEYESGSDRLIAFEGGTGVVSVATATSSASATAASATAVSHTTPSWSLMGFVLMQKTATGYDAHIVFRGSRSGASLATTVWKAQDKIGVAKGNPDWITDLHSGKQVEQPLISKVGKVTEGFSAALPTMLGTITGCCKFLEQNYPPPEHIYVTGHSLGAGLASQFVSAVEQGSFGDEIRQQVKSWPWQHISLLTYAQPIPGDPSWAADMNKNVPDSTHYWVEGDAVVESTSSKLVNMLIDEGSQCGAQKKLSLVPNCSDNPHEVFVIREGLLQNQNSDIAKKHSSESTWGYYDSLSKMLRGEAKSYKNRNASSEALVSDTNLRQMLRCYNFGPEFAAWLEAVYAKMIAEKSSYIGPKFQSTLDERKKVVLAVASQLRKAATSDKSSELGALAEEFSLVNDKLGLSAEEQWIYCGMILAKLQDSSLNLDDLQSKPEIKNCIDRSVSE